MLEMGRDQTKAKCGICEQVKEDGYYIYHMYICATCEQAIIHTDPTDESYHLYVDKLKAINHSLNV